MGTPDFAVPSLKQLIDEGYDVRAVVTQPDRPKGRTKQMTPPPVKEVAAARGIPVLQPLKIAEETEDVLAYEPDLIVTAAYGQILPRVILDAPQHGCVNVHASLLPRYRGGAPIHHAMINGEKETGITIMYMVPELDAGDMLAHVTVPINDRDTVGTMHDTLSEKGAALLLQTLEKIERGTVEPLEQDHDRATYAKNITRADEWIDWSQSSRAIYNRVRGLHPWPVAYTTWKGKRLKLWWVEEETKDPSAVPGTVLDVKESGILVAAGDGAVSLQEVQPEGKQRMTVGDFVRGKGSEIRPGDRLGESP